MRLFSGFVFGTVLALAAGSGAPPAAAQSDAGPFTDAQASAGHSLFTSRCANCHGARAEASMRMTGPGFSNVWATGTTLDLFTVIKTKMPPNAPGILSDAGTAALVAYILSANGATPGTIALAPTTAVPINTIIAGLPIPKECVGIGAGAAAPQDSPQAPPSLPDASAQALGFIACANAYAKQGLLDQAIVFFNNAVTTDPSFATYYQRGNFYYNQGLGDQAIPDLTQAIALYGGDPPAKKPAKTPAPVSLADYANAYFIRGISYQHENDYDQALPDYNRAIALQPTLTDAYENRAEVYAHNAQYDLAIADFTQVIAHRPGYTYYYNRAFAYEGKGSADQAMADFNKVVTLAPDFAYGYSERGKLREKNGLKAEAVADYRAALKLDPAIAEAKDGLARLNPTQ